MVIKPYIKSAFCPCDSKRAAVKHLTRINRHEENTQLNTIIMPPNWLLNGGHGEFIEIIKIYNDMNVASKNSTKIRLNFTL